MVLFNFFVFLLVVFVFFVAASASDSPSSFFLSSILSCFFLSSCCFFFLGGGGVCFLVVIYFSSYFFLFLCFFLFSTSVILICFSFLSCFFACISFDCSCCCDFCPYSSSFASCVSSSPQAPSPHFKRKTMQKKTSISFCLPFGDLCKISFQTLSVKLNTTA